MSNIPKNKLLIYLIALSFLPLIIVFFYHSSQSSYLNTLNLRAQKVHNRLLTEKDKLTSNAAISQRHQKADPHFVNSSLEALPLLEEETEALRKILDNPAFPESALTKKRLDFLQGMDNKLIFTEENIQTYPHFKETTEKLRRAVEIDLNDLYKILAKVEGVKIKLHSPDPLSPQLIITHFKLERKKKSHKNEVFLLNLKLLKREFY